MNRQLFGQCLGHVVQLTDHDVAEILEDQTTTRRRFGEIALSWNLCKPQDIWNAWCHQLARLTPEVNLDTLGIDAQALSHVPHSVAQQFGVVPVRAFGDQLVLAVDAAGLGRASNELPRLLSKTIKLVVAPKESIRKAITHYYARHDAHTSIAG